MSIVNRRNAVVGWAALKAGKRIARKKAREAVPGTVDDSLRPNKSAIALAVAALGGALLFWRKRAGGDQDDGGPAGP
jgi:hypothetical protein